MDQVKLFSSVIRARVREFASTNRMLSKDLSPQRKQEKSATTHTGTASFNSRRFSSSAPDNSTGIPQIRRLRPISLRGRTIAQHAGRAIGYELAPVARSYRVVAFRAGLCRSRTLAVM